MLLLDNQQDFYKVALHTDHAVCQAFGDPHYAVFDGGKISYQGKCRHLLAGPCPGDVPAGMPNFQIM